MATTPTAQQQPPQEPQPSPNLTGVVAGVLAAGGATVAALAPAAAGAVAAGGLALTAVQIAKLTGEILDRTKGFMTTRAATATAQLEHAVEQAYPALPKSRVEALVREEAQREVEFRRKMMARLAVDIPKALALEDIDARREALKQILEREQRYTEMREEAMSDRAMMAAEHDAVKGMSPRGAFWVLSPFVKMHTPDCVALGGKWWPWSVIEAVGGPPRHVGCRCQLLTEDEAVQAGYIEPGYADQVNEKDALRRAKKLLKDAGTVMEALSEAEWEAWLVMLEEAALAWAWTPSAGVHPHGGGVAFVSFKHPRGRAGKFRSVGVSRSEWHKLPHHLRHVVGDSRDDDTVRVVHHQGQAVGAISFRVHPDTTEVTHIASTHKGAGMFLMHDAMRAAAVNGHDVSVAATPKSEGFFTHLGFEKVGVDERGHSLMRLSREEVKRRLLMNRSMEEADFKPGLHPRDRLGKWQKKFPHLVMTEPFGGHYERMIVARDPHAEDPDWERIHAEGRFDMEPERKGSVAQVDFKVQEPHGDELGHIDVGLVYTSPEHRRKGHGIAVLAKLADTYPPDKYVIEANGVGPGGRALLRKAVDEGALPPGKFEKTKEIYKGENVVKYTSHPTARRGTPPGLARKPEQPQDTPQQKAVLRQSAAARKVRKLYPAGTRVTVTPGAGAEPREGAMSGTVVRHVPGTDAQGGSLTVLWDNGHRGRISPGSVTHEKLAEAYNPAEHLRGRAGRWIDMPQVFMGQRARLSKIKPVRNGSFKPNGGLWTSSRRPSGTTEWHDWVKGDMPEWLGPEHDFTASPDARVAEINSVKDLEALAKRYPPPNPLSPIDWEKMGQDYDAIHFSGQLPDRWSGRYDAMGQLLYALDVESTFWFRPKFMEKLDEAELLRYPKGTKEGGQFMPRVGAHPHLISPLKRALLHRLFPEMPRVPTRQRHEGTDHRLGGRRVFVPLEREFRRTLNGRTFHSPAGSTHVYTRDEPSLPHGWGGLDKPPTDVPVEQLEQDRKAQFVQIDAQIAHALAVNDPGTPPALEDNLGWPTDQQLREAGFLETDVRGVFRGVTMEYLAPDGVSRLSVTYDKHGGRVLHVTWEPQQPPPEKTELTRPPHTFQEFTDDLEATARRIGREHDKTVTVNSFTAVPPGSDEFTDNSAQHSWDGEITLGADVQPEIMAAAAARALGKDLSHDQLRGVWAGTQTGLHEAVGHGVNPTPRELFSESPNLVLEEGIAEELSQVEAARTLARQGQTDVVQWAADHPTDQTRLGTYLSYRRAIDIVLNDAGIEPDEREDYLRNLKFTVKPENRVEILANDVAANKGITQDEAQARVEHTLNSVGQPDFEDAPVNTQFVPVLAPDLTPSKTPHPFEIMGSPVSVGDEVIVNRTNTVTHEIQPMGGYVTDLKDQGNGVWTASVSYPELHGLVDYAVLPGEIAGVRSETGDQDRLSFGAGAPSAEINGNDVHEGQKIQFGPLNARNTPQQGTVTRVIRDRDPLDPDTPNQWVIEAVTDTGKRVILTHERVAGHIEPLPTEHGVPTPEGAAPQLTLNKKAQVQYAFHTPPGTRVVPTAALKGRHTPTSQAVADEVQRLRQGTTKHDPLPVTRSHDGRLEVLDRPETLRAARTAGITHLPVREARFPRAEVIRELDDTITKRQTQMDAYPGDEQDRGMLAGLNAARAIIQAGGGQADIVKAAKQRGKSRSDHDKGFQVGMRQGWLSVDEVVEQQFIRSYQQGLTAGEGRARGSTASRIARWDAAMAGLAKKDKSYWDIFMGGPPEGGGWGLGKLFHHDEEKPVDFDPSMLKAGEKARVRDKDGKVWELQWSTEKNLIFVDPAGGPLSKEPIALSDLPAGLKFLGTKQAQTYTPPPPPKPVTDDTGQVTTTKPAGGSNGAMFAQDKQGRSWLVKQYRGDQDRVATELLGNAVYRELGIKVPEAGELHFEGKVALGYPLLEGEEKPWKGADPKLAEGFMADALLANWDVVGLSQDNVLWSPEGEPFRVDQGGTLQYRAQGEPKPFGPVPSEVWTMNQPGGQAFGRMAITEATKRQGAAEIAEKLTPGKIDGLVDAAPFKNEKMREEVREALKARVAWMGDYASQGSALEPQPARGLQAALMLAGNQRDMEVPPEAVAAAQAWGEGWMSIVNDHLRTGAPKEPKQKEVRFLISEMSALVKEAGPTPESFEGWYVLPQHVLPVGGKEALVDKVMSDKGFTGLGLVKPSQPRAGGALMRLLVPKGSRGVFLRGLPDTPVRKGPEFLLPRGSRMRVVGVDAEGVVDAVLL